MFEFIKKGLIFIKKNPGIFFSLFLIIVLPLALYFNTFLTIQSLQRAIDRNLELQSMTVNNILGSLVARDFSDKESLNQSAVQHTIDVLSGNIQRDEGKNANAGDLARGNVDLENIRVIIKDGMDYRVIAAQDTAQIGKNINTDPSLNGEAMIAIGWSNATDMMGAVEEGNDNFWRIMKVLTDYDTGEVYGLIVGDIPLRELDSMVSAAILQAYAILIATIIMVLVLILWHTRLFSYVLRSSELEEQCKIKDQFIRMAGHELQAPVTNIRGYIEALGEELAVGGTEIQKQYLERISISANGLAKLIFDILEVSHLQQGKMDFAPQEIMPAEIVGQIVNNVKLKAEAKGLKISYQLGDFHYHINVNQNRFTQIVTNLIENAIKYTPAGEIKVAIKAETGRRRCIITVQDTGFGISAEGQKRLFEQFYRVKTNENSGIPGTGLGLWMSREMARKMGGDIMLESIERMGSRFFVIFPLSDK